MGQGAGDKLARGSVRADFPAGPGGKKITQESWDSMFADFDLEKFRKETADAQRLRDSNPDSNSDGDVSTDAREA